MAAVRTATPTVLLRPPGALAAAGSMLLPAVATPNRPGATDVLESAANVVPRARTHTRRLDPLRNSSLRPVTSKCCLAC